MADESRRTTLWLVLGLWIALLPVSAGRASHRSANESKKPLPPVRLIRDALVASGVEEPDRIHAYVIRFEQLCKKFDEEIGTAVRPPDLAVADVHRFLHEQVLTGAYDAACSRVDRALDEGVYNCVSATVLFHAFCRHLSIEPVAVVRRTHVFSRLPEASLDVETTCAQWSDASSTDDLQGPEEAGEREIDDDRLIGKIYFNRGVELLDRGQFPEALRWIRTSLAWDADDPSARENLLAGLNNWALTECKAGRFQAAAELIDEGLAVDGAYEPLLANDLHVRQRWAVDLCDRSEFAKARDVLQHGFERRPDVALFDAGRLVVYHRWARSLLLDGGIQNGFAIFEEARRVVGHRMDVAECEAATVAGCVQELRESGRTAEAARIWSAVRSKRRPGA